MKRKTLGIAGLAVAATLAAGAAAEDGIPFRKVADMLYQVMSADREVYTRRGGSRSTTAPSHASPPPRHRQRQADEPAAARGVEADGLGDHPPVHPRGSESRD